MNTRYLSDEEEVGYLRDLVGRLEQLGDAMPTTWCPIGPSGILVARAAMRIADSLASRIEVVPVIFDRKLAKASFADEPHPQEAIEGKRVLLVDGAVHSGGTIAAAYRAVESLRPLDIASYALVVRRSASMIPNYFGFIVKDHDRVHLPAPRIPNNRLLELGCVRTLSGDDLDKPMVETGRHFIDKFTWSDLVYEMRADVRRKTYLYERHGMIQGFVSFRLGGGKALLVDTLGVGQSYQRQGIAGCLMRWVETLGRHNRCRRMCLWGVEERREWYENRGYRTSGDCMTLDGVKFYLMRKKLLYNLPDSELLC